jgi:hypothetical protein
LTMDMLYGVLGTIFLVDWVTFLGKMLYVAVVFGIMIYIGIYFLIFAAKVVRYLFTGVWK